MYFVEGFKKRETQCLFNLECFVWLKKKLFLIADFVTDRLQIDKEEKNSFGILREESLNSNKKCYIELCLDNFCEIVYAQERNVCS